MIREDEVYKIGVVTRTHGVKGEVSLTFTDDVWDRAEADFLVLRIDGILVPFYMEEYRFRSDTTALVKFVDYDNAETAQELCSCEVYFPYSLTPQANEDDEYTWRYFTGFLVIDEHAGELGKIEYVDDSTQNILFQIADRFIPAAEEFILDIDHKGRTITMSLPEGLLDL